MKIANSIGRLVGSTIGTLFLSGAVNFGVTILSGLSAFSTSIIRELVVRGSLSADYLSKKTMDKESLAELISEIKVLTKEGQLKERVANAVVNQLEKIHLRKLEITEGSKTSNNTDENSFWNLVQQKYEAKIASSKSLEK